MSNPTHIILSLGAAALLLTLPTVARADLAACGGVYLSVDAACEFVPTETCTTHCEDVAMETDCAARLYTTCEGECTATAEVACVETCTTDCTPVCTTHEADPAPPNAMGLCMSDCQQDCTDDCAGAANKGECRSSCAHTCGELCEKRCDGDDSTTCAPRCDVACEGSCTAQASSACQVTCQSKQFTTCKTEQVQVCEKDCKETGGALFCDGQFLAVTDLQACADELFAEHITPLIAEHRELATLLESVDLTFAADQDRFRAAFDELYEHIAKEEDGLFPASLTALDGDAWDTAILAWRRAHPGAEPL